MQNKVSFCFNVQGPKKIVASLLFASTSQAIAIWPYPQIGKWEESLHQVDNYIDKWRAAPSVLLIMNYLGSKS